MSEPDDIMTMISQGYEGGDDGAFAVCQAYLLGIRVGKKQEFEIHAEQDTTEDPKS